MHLNNIASGANASPVFNFEKQSYYYYLKSIRKHFYIFLHFIFMTIICILSELALLAKYIYFLLLKPEAELYTVFNLFQKI